jgi:hypothetical protein
VKRWKVELVIDEDPRLTPREIASKANVGLGHLTVDKIISQSKFRLIVPRKNPFWRKGQKDKPKDLASVTASGQKRCGGRLFSSMNVRSNTILVPPERKFVFGRVKS